VMGTISKKFRKVQRKVGPRTGVIREVPLAKMHECTLQIHLSERVISLRVSRRTRLIPLLPAPTNS
jgi:hypothetical protein